MPRIKLVVNLPYTTGLPRDVSQQTWCFLIDSLEETSMNDICEVVSRFYNEPVGSFATSISRYFSSVIDRSLCWIDIYDVASVPTGPPIFSKAMTFGTAYAATSLPLEVALVNSFQGDKITSMPQSRRRGRNYLGPFNTYAMSADAGLPRPLLDLIVTMNAASKRLQEEAISDADAEWCVWSRTTDLFVPVTNGWVNNEWDTQRRREAKETDRRRWFSDE